jgi:hypothetical protein
MVTFFPRRNPEASERTQTSIFSRPFSARGTDCWTRQASIITKARETVTIASEFESLKSPDSRPGLLVKTH